MITPMQKITICGLNSQRKLVMERLQKSGCVELVRDSDSELDTVTVSDGLIRIERNLSVCRNALDILDEYSPPKSKMFFQRKDISLKYFSMDIKESEETDALAIEIINAEKSIREQEARLGTLNASAASLAQWKSLDVPLDFDGTRTTEAGLYICSQLVDEKTARELFEPVSDYMTAELISSGKEISCFFVIYLKDYSDDALIHLRESRFVRASSEEASSTPGDRIGELNDELKKTYADIQKLKDKINSYTSKRDKLRLYHDQLILRRDRYKALEKVSLTDETFILEGFVPEKMASLLKKLLSDLVCSLDYVSTTNEKPPVMFENNAFVSPVEGITTSYSMPSPRDIDPNAIMSIFYYLFFGMMFSDAGYGLLMVIACGYLGFIAKVEPGLKRNMRMFFYCGLSTMFWGFMYGGFFGDILPNLRPLWINPIEEPLTLLIFSVALGVIQIVIGLILKFYVDFRAGERVSAIFDTLSWIIMLTGISLAIIGVTLKTDILKKSGIILAFAGVLMVVIMKNRETLNPFKRLFSGILALYDITSYVSDFLSYSRLMALGLATGVIANVVNIMSALGGEGLVGTASFVFIFVFGHALNFAINVLGAYVHTNRLQYVEFYSKFYEGGGRAFSPLNMNTKYYNFMEVEKR